MSNNVVLVKCKHGYVNGKVEECNTCKGSGYVKVVVGVDGKPKECEHGHSGQLEDCLACRGSGWAGLVKD